MKEKKLIFNIFCDGGARGNPGPAGVGFVVKDPAGKILTKQAKAIGVATNNVAEYQAVIEALIWLKENQKTFNFKLLTFNFYLDSTLVVNQLNGFFKIKNPHLRELIFEVRIREQELGGKIFYHSIPREKNFLADALVNQALDRS